MWHSPLGQHKPIHKAFTVFFIIIMHLTGHTINLALTIFCSSIFRNERKIYK